MRKAALIAILMLQACASGGIRPLRPYEIATAPYHEPATQSLVGSLLYEGGCLTFESEDHSTRVLPIWPTQSRFEESLVTFHQPGKAEQRLIVGEEIRLDGQPSDWSSVGPAFAPFQRQCGATPFFVSGVAPAN